MQAGSHAPWHCWVKGRWVKGPNTALEPQLLVESPETTDSEDRMLLRTMGFSQKQAEMGKPYHNFRNPLDAGALCGLWVHQVCCDGRNFADWSCGLIIMISRSQPTTPKCCSSTVPCPSLSHGTWASPWELAHSSGGVSKAAGAAELLDMHPPSPQEAELHWTDAAEHRAGVATIHHSPLSQHLQLWSWT